MHRKSSSDNLKGRGHLGDIDVDGRIILEGKGKAKVVPVL
jgi:hypothetical protein